MNDHNNPLPLPHASPEGTYRTEPASALPAHGMDAGPKPGAVNSTLYTTEELARWLRVSPATIEKDRSLGRGNYPAFVKVGGRRICYLHEDIVRWLQARRFNHDNSFAAPLR